MTRAKPPGTKRARRTVAALDCQGYGVQAIAKRAHLGARAVARILAYQEQEWRQKTNHQKEH